MLYGGQAVAFLGRQITIVAAPLQVFELTGSSAMVGLLGLAQLPLLIVGSLLGGTLADAHERRRLLLIANVFPLLFAAGLAVNAARPGGGSVWPIFVLTAVQAGVSGIDSPTRSAVTPELVGPGGDPVAYRIRGALIALRRSQAAEVLVADPEAGDATPVDPVEEVA